MEDGLFSYWLDPDFCELHAVKGIRAIGLAASLGAALDVFATRNGKGAVEDHVVASIDALREELVSAVTALGRVIVAAMEGLRDEISLGSGGVAPT